jgi:hypothetical protein
MIYVSGSQIQLPSSPIQLTFGAGGTNPLGAVAPPGGGYGLLKLDGTLSLSVTSAVSYDKLQVIGQLDGPGAVAFSFANNSVASTFSSTFTSDSFFPDIPFGEYSGLGFSATSPSQNYGVTLNPDHTFTLAPVPEPSTIALAVASALGLICSRSMARPAGRLRAQHVYPLES